MRFPVAKVITVRACDTSCRCTALALSVLILGCTGARASGSTPDDDEESCGFSLTVAGVRMEGEAGDRVAFTDVPRLAGGDHQLMSVHLFDASTGVESTFTPTNGGQTPIEALPSVPGSYSGVGFGSVGFSGFYAAGGNVGTFDVHEYVKQEFLRGAVDLTVVELGNDANVMSLKSEFTVRLPEGYAPVGARYTCTIQGSG